MTTPLLATPPTVTTTLPVVAPDGTAATIDVALQLVIVVAAVPLNVTTLVPCVEPKLVPVIVTDAPIAAAFVDKLAMLGACSTVNGVPLLLIPFTLTTTFPDVAPLGTRTVMLVAVQFVGVAGVPLKLTVLLPWVDPKLTPLIVTETPATPDVGDKLLTVGGCDTTKGSPLLETPFTVTTTFPDVAPLGTGTEILVEVHVVGVPFTPLNVTELVP
jgi:hypothetical protein